MARLYLLGLLISLLPVAWAGPPDAIFIGGNIHTLDPQRPRAEAIAVAGGWIVDVGRTADVLSARGDETRVIQLDGATVVPGLIDAHAHLASLGSLLTGRLDLVRTRSYDQLVARVKRETARQGKGRWILGGRWDQANWGQQKLPIHDRLSAATPEHPVWLIRIDGHAGLANRRAMTLAGITGETPDPPGGHIVKDARGEPTGVFVDKAMGLIARAVRGRAGKGLATLMLAAQQRCLSVGLTGVHDAGLSPHEVWVLRQLADSGKLTLRVYGMLTPDPSYLKQNKPLINHAGHRLTVRAVKCMIDGALGSRGAWLLAPYSDRPTDHRGKPYIGLPVQSTAFIRRVCDAALANGYQVCTHAIGDRGNREVLDLYQAALKQRPVEDHRFRIEHAQVIALADIPRFAQLGVIPSMQPTHATSDMRWAEARLGPKRLAGAYAWARLLRAGSRIAAGSDFPVESEKPLWGFYAAVTRQNHQGLPSGGWRPQERMTRTQALRAFTLDAAYAAFEEQQKGSLKVGKLADFVVLSKDIMTCDPADILRATCRMTVVGGQVVYRAR